MKKKQMILPAAVLLAFSLLLTACQNGSNGTEETIPGPTATETTLNEPDRQIEPTETQGEPEMSPVEQPETNEEMDVGKLLVPNATEGDVPPEGEEDPDTPPTEEETQQPTEPQPTEPEEVPEETLPDTTQPPNDGYSDYWY